MLFVLLHVLVLCLSVCRPAEWALKLDALVALADKRTEERKTELAKKAGAGPQAQADLQRHIQLWRLRQQLYYRMRENFQNTGQRSACGISLFRCLALKLRSVFFLFSVNSRSFFPLILYFCSHNKTFSAASAVLSCQFNSTKPPATADKTAVIKSSTQHLA